MRRIVAGYHHHHPTPRSEEKENYFTFSKGLNDCPSFCPRMCPPFHVQPCISLSSVRASISQCNTPDYCLIPTYTCAIRGNFLLTMTEQTRVSVHASRNACFALLIMDNSKRRKNSTVSKVMYTSPLRTENSRRRLTYIFENKCRKGAKERNTPKLLTTESLLFRLHFLQRGEKVYRSFQIMYSLFLLPKLPVKSTRRPIVVLRFFHTCKAL